MLSVLSSVINRNVYAWGKKNDNVIFFKSQICLNIFQNYIPISLLLRWKYNEDKKCRKIPNNTVPYSVGPYLCDCVVNYNLWFTVARKNQQSVLWDITPLGKHKNSNYAYWWMCISILHHCNFQSMSCVCLII